MEENDLDILLGELNKIDEGISESKTISEESEITKNINLLDEEKNEPEVNVVTPESLLDEYSKYDLKNEELEVKIEELKAKNPEIFKAIEDINKEIQSNIEKQSKIKEDIKESLKANDQKNVKNDFWTVTYVASYIKTTFDRASFEKKYPVLAKQFITTSTVSDSTRWTRKKK